MLFEISTLLLNFLKVKFVMSLYRVISLNCITRVNYEKIWCKNNRFCQALRSSISRHTFCGRIKFWGTYTSYTINIFCPHFSEDIPKSGTTISDLIMNSSVTLTPMFNLGKARRESTQRKEKYVNPVVYIYSINYVYICVCKSRPVFTAQFEPDV